LVYVLAATVLHAEATNLKSRQWTSEISNLRSEISKLSLRELEAFACALLSVLLALFDSRITGNQSRVLQRRPQVGIVFEQRASDAVANCAGLARRPAAGYVRQDVELVVVSVKFKG